MQIEEIQSRLKPYKIEGLFAIQLTADEITTLRMNTPLGLWVEEVRQAGGLNDPTALVVIGDRLVVQVSSAEDLMPFAIKLLASQLS